MQFRDLSAAIKIEARHGRTVLPPGQRVSIQGPCPSEGWTIANHSIETDFETQTGFVLYELRKDRLLTHAPAKFVVAEAKPVIVEVPLNDG